jgi:hypothetical protein
MIIGKFQRWYFSHVSTPFFIVFIAWFEWPKPEEASDHYLPDYEFKAHNSFEDTKAMLALFLVAFEAGDNVWGNAQSLFLA